MSEMIDSLAGVIAVLPNVASPENLLYAVIGLSVGIAWGAIPGLSSTMAMALLVGFSPSLEREAAIVFLLSVYSGSVFGGSISAICTNIPGTPAAACTALEGYPLFCRGEGGKALGTSITASFIGNLFGAVILILFTPSLLALAMRVGAWEIFLLGLWGVLICGSVTSQESTLKGWVSGFIGLGLAFIGIDSLSGQTRFTFGIPFLYSGLSFIAVLIGLFGFAEIARGLLLEDPYTVSKISRVGVPWREMPRNAWNILRSSSLGAIIGAIPAAGADIAAFLSYSVSRRSATPADRELYGKGSYRGIIAAESANNSSVGGSLLPLLVLGIPGSTVAATFLGALNLHGIQVGPMIEMNHPGLLQFIFGTMVVVSVLMFFVAFGISRIAIAFLSIPREVLLPSIMPICVMGAFAAHNNAADIYVMVIAGMAGIALVAGGFPLAPIIMGLILGPLVEQNFRRSMIIFKDKDLIDILHRPVGLVLIVIIAFTVLRPLFSVWFKRKHNPPPA